VDFNCRSYLKSSKCICNLCFLTFFFGLQLSKIDAKIMRNVAVMHQLEHELGRSYSLDYRMILVPLMKSFLQVCIQHPNSVSSQCLIFLVLRCLVVAAVCNADLFGRAGGQGCQREI